MQLSRSVCIAVYVWRRCNCSHEHTCEPVDEGPCTLPEPEQHDWNYTANFRNSQYDLASLGNAGHLRALAPWRQSWRQQSLTNRVQASQTSKSPLVLSVWLTCWCAHMCDQRHVLECIEGARKWHVAFRSTWKLSSYSAH